MPTTEDSDRPSGAQESEADVAPPAPVPEPIIQAPTPQPATAEQLSGVQREMTGFEKSTLLFAKLAFGVSILAAIFVGLQWKVMSDTLREMRQSGNTATNQLWQAIGNMNWMARIADGSLGQARNALNANIEASRRDQRAWVEIEPIKAVFISPADAKFGALFKYPIYPKNVGRTAAYDIVIRAQNVSSSDALSGNLHGITMIQDRLFRDSKTGARITEPPPNPIPKVLAPGTTSPVPFMLAGQEPRRYQSGGSFLEYLIGRIDYGDAFGVKHWMRFCFTLVNSQGELRSCEAGNDEDRNPENPN